MFSFWKKEKIPFQIEDEWIGFYRYIGTNIANRDNLKVKFHAFINGNTSSFNGTITEDVSTGGIAESSTISGYIKGNKIIFEKRYKNNHFYNEYGESFTVFDEGEHIVNYKGYFDKKKNLFWGTWEIFDNYTSGYWEMKRAVQDQ
ncbi:MAG: hypothetical protein CMO01_25090 [Thalassobius sp.]|nr:hypothetical protein [Thalassovita sp.]|tara:strand:+ start:125 stop:559 length:435 start_codon:yes stop_codon:yes gene_type:complete